MSSTKDGIIIILSSPSGAGKTTLVRKISSLKDYIISVSYTTRKPRTDEVNGIDYFFVSQDEFKQLINNDEFLEYAKVFENYYGSSKKKVFDNLNKGENVIFDIDWQGTKQIKEKKLNYKLITFFILPPSKKVLFERLSNRHMNDEFVVDERMKQFDKDILHWVDYDYVVINDNLQNCFNQVSNLIKSEIEKTPNTYNIQLIKDHVNYLIE